MSEESSTSSPQDHGSGRDVNPDIWKNGDKFRYPIPKFDGNHYEKLLAPLLQRDRVQCNAWKDEVQNLLIFAGLFSAIVTAFVVETVDSLQPDPADTIILLLSRVAVTLDANATVGLTPPQIPFQPDPHFVHINIFLFISLVLSVTTVLIGIVSLQWLREHQTYDVTLTPDIQFALFNLRAHSFKRWYVPQMFAALPILLQAALIFFLIGIGEFLLVVEKNVAIPVILVIGLPLLFLFVTTTFPTYQVFALYLPLRMQVNESTPSPCPYKSPQSRIFFRLATISERLFRCYVWIFQPFYLAVVTFPRQFFHLPESLKNVHQFSRGARLDNTYDWWQTRDLWSKHGAGWGVDDVLWLSIRTRYSRFMYDLTFWREVVRPSNCDDKPLYDITHGFRHVVLEKPDIVRFYSLYHCVMDLSSRTIRDWKRWSNRRIHSNPSRENHFLQILLRSLRMPSFRDSSMQLLLLPDNTSSDMMHETNLHAFLTTMAPDYSLYRRFPVLRNHMYELHVRIMAAFLTKKLGHVLFSGVDRGEWSHYGPFGYQALGQHPAGQPKRHFPLPDAISDQWGMILLSFFKVIANQNREFDINWDTNYSLKAIFQIATENRLQDTFWPSLNFITDTLWRYLDYSTPQDKSPHLLFYVAAFYIDALEKEHRGGSVPGLAALIPPMRRYFRHIDTAVINLDVNADQEIQPIHICMSWLPDIFQWHRPDTPTSFSGTRSFSGGGSTEPGSAAPRLDMELDGTSNSMRLSESGRVSPASFVGSNIVVCPPSPSPPPSVAPSRVIEIIVPKADSVL